MTDAGPIGDLRSASLEELETRVGRLGEKPFRARQIFRWLHRRWVRSLDEMTDVPKGLRERLSAGASLTTLEEDLRQVAPDGTVKFRFRTGDGLLLESVFIPEEKRRTLCVSTQVGCAMGCAFCMTSTMGLVRNLTAGEIVDQVHRVNAALVEQGVPGPRPLTNLVFMGMGEPLHNWDEVKRALDILLSSEGPDFSHRHVTVSTVGMAPMIERLGRESLVKLAISLNATTDEQRSALMPVNRKWDLAALVDACRRFPVRQGRRITFEYVMLAGVNDSDEDAARLARLVKGLPAKVNLVPYNENPGLPFRRVDDERTARFRDLLVAENVTAGVRRSRGGQIAAACGQLVAPGRRAR